MFLDLKGKLSKITLKLTVHLEDYTLTLQDIDLLNLSSDVPFSLTSGVLREKLPVYCVGGVGRLFVGMDNNIYFGVAYLFNSAS